MTESITIGAVVPSVKQDSMPSTSTSTTQLIETESEPAPPDQLPATEMEAAKEDEEVVGDTMEQDRGGDGAGVVLDKEFLCPICMQLMKDAFLTACGHSYCYVCIVTHLRNKNDCPCCGHFLSTGLIFPNFALDKLVRKMSCREVEKSATPFERLHWALKQGFEVSKKEVDSLLSLLADKKRKMEKEEAEANMQILLEFFCYLREQKLQELNELRNDLQYINEDLKAVETHRIKERYSIRLRKVAPDSAAVNDIRSARGMQDHMTSCPQSWEVVNVPGPSQELLGDTAVGDPNLPSRSQSGFATARRKRMHSQLKELQKCYLQKRRNCSKLPCSEEGGINTSGGVGYHAGLKDFQSVLSTFTRYSQLRVIAELRPGDFFHTTNIISSIEFDRDDELFALAGVSRCIKLFEFSTVVNEPTDVHFPVVDIATRSKLSCLSWNQYTRNHIASSDYEGIVTVWDVSTRQSVLEFEEHEKRVWSVDFSRTEPSMLVSGSDDCKVKIWCTKQEDSVMDLNMRANVCSVKFNPGSSIHVAVGSADHSIHYYDLRNTSQPVHVFTGHKKTVSYVKFMSRNELVSASTDSTLRSWDVRDYSPIQTYQGHTNEKNFVGLSANREYIACGSETNEVVVYHKDICRPAVKRRIISSQLEEVDEEIGSYFVSAVAWKNEGHTMMAANSQGTIKVLALAA